MLLNTLIKLCVYLAVFLTPLVFSPFSSEPFEFPRQLVLFFLISFGLFLWFAKMVLQDKEVVLKKTPLNFPVLMFLGAAFLSLLFSQDTRDSILGSYQRFSDGFLSIVSFIGLYFLIINTVSFKDIEKLLKVFFASALLGAVAALLFPSFATEGFLLFLAVVSVMVVAFPAPWWQKLFLVAFFVLFFMYTFSSVWIVLLGGFVLLLLFFVLERIRLGEQLSIKKIWLPVLLLFVSFIFLFSPPSLSLGFGRANPSEIMLSQNGAWRIGVATAFGNIKDFFFGSGLATFQIDVAHYGKNQFEGSGNFLSELLASQGVVGLFSYIFLVGIFLLTQAFRIAYSFTKLHAMLFAATGALLVGQFFYHQNVALGFVFWFVVSLGAVPFAKKEIHLSLKKFVEIALAARVALFLLIFALGILYFFAARFYRADIAYAKALQRDTPRDTKIVHILRAARLNPYRAEYPLFASQLYLQNVGDELKKSSSKQNQETISLNAQKAILFGVQAGAMAQNRKSVIEALAFTYRSLSFVRGASDWATRLYERAIALEPANPLLYNEVGKLYLAKSNPTPEDFAKAKGAFGKALSLNPNFTDALLQEGLLLEREGDLVGAIAKIKNLAIANPYNPEVLFQLGRLYFNANEISSAVSELQRAIALDPAYSNAHYALARAYEKEGQREKAIEEYKKVLELNPENQEVVEKLKNL